MKKITLLVVNKDSNWTSQLKSCLSENEFNLMWESNREQALDKYYENNTEIDGVVIITHYADSFLRQMVESIRAYSTVPIVFISDHQDEETQLMLYRAGVDDYLPYDYPARLFAAKMNVVKRRVFGKNGLISEGILEMNPSRKKIKVAGKDVSITAKEFELLYYLIMNREVIQTRDQILTAVWGINYMGNDRVVDSLVKKLRSKLGQAASYIKTVYAMGYYFETSE